MSPKVRRRSKEMVDYCTFASASIGLGGVGVGIIIGWILKVEILKKSKTSQKI